MSGTPMTQEHIRGEFQAKRASERLMAIVAEGERVYLSPTAEHEEAAREAKPNWKPDTNLPDKALGFRVQEYGMTQWGDLFTPRQLVALSTFSDLIGEATMRRYTKAALAGGRMQRRSGCIWQWLLVRRLTRNRLFVAGRQPWINL